MIYVGNIFYADLIYNIIYYIYIKLLLFLFLFR
jgi:hypothetical protein